MHLKQEISKNIECALPNGRNLFPLKLRVSCVAVMCWRIHAFVSFWQYTMITSYMRYSYLSTIDLRMKENLIFRLFRLFLYSVRILFAYYIRLLYFSSRSKNNTLGKIDSDKSLHGDDQYYIEKDSKEMTENCQNVWCFCFKQSLYAWYPLKCLSLEILSKSP